MGQSIHAPKIEEHKFVLTCGKCGAVESLVMDGVVGRDGDSCRCGCSVLGVVGTFKASWDFTKTQPVITRAVCGQCKSPAGVEITANVAGVPSVQ
jgi:hypothetical protein